jgi:hypothetical protein
VVDLDADVVDVVVVAVVVAVVDAKRRRTSGMLNV